MPKIMYVSYTFRTLVIMFLHSILLFVSLSSNFLHELTITLCYSFLNSFAQICQIVFLLLASTSLASYMPFECLILQAFFPYYVPHNFHLFLIAKTSFHSPYNLTSCHLLYPSQFHFYNHVTIVSIHFSFMRTLSKIHCHRGDQILYSSPVHFPSFLILFFNQFNNLIF